jgi:CubicO group peptidase (beta-lactamase class C family)
MKPITHSKIILFCLLLSVSCLKAQDVLEYANPSEVGLDSTYIYKNVDSIMTLGIQSNAFPGAQVLVAKDSKIIFHQAYGFHTYDSLQKVDLDDVYDLASVTKIAGALPALMKLVDEGRIDLDQPFSRYWKRWGDIKDKKELTLREILAHQSGLEPYIVFLNKVIRKNGKIKKRFIKRKPRKGFTNQIYDNLYVSNRFDKKMYRIIDRSKVSSEKIYKYSGLTFLIFPELISQLLGQSYATYLQESF